MQLAKDECERPEKAVQLCKATCRPGAAGMFLMLFPPLVAGARQKVATPGAASGAGAWAAGQHQHEAADQGWKPQWSIA